MSDMDNHSPRSEAASPTRISDPKMRIELHKAFIWTLVVGGVYLAVTIAQSILIIFGALVFSAMIDGGTRLLGRVLPIARSWRVAIVLTLATLFLLWLGYFAGTQIAEQAAAFSTLIGNQIGRVFAWAQQMGFAVDQSYIKEVIGQISNGVGTITRAIGGVVGGLTTMLLIAIIGIFIAIEPNLYERGVSWMVARERRDNFHATVSAMGYSLRRLLAGRLLGMGIEGVFTYLMLTFGGMALGIGAVPMAALLALLTGLLAFIPNIGALVSGALMILVGFSGGTEMGLYTIFVYFAVQTIDGYILIPMIAKKAVDLAPALVLAAQLILGALFGILGLALADPIIAMIKVALERRSQHNDADDAARAKQIKAEQKKTAKKATAKS
ncbi:AI-2E family transporter [Pseudoblastomonas halimionae]|uniref:AI-2E family transporter n=1 Tax=Alteriqipengyuania halimionae TaxID=1926630 RepID=A0A6I4U1C4_9SPHN|nr:AI-2E family transporter [Alteriqipengyuania halimionae]MXP08703.1 AI-2E family transporter [Alteriqipengyuania halimionae]